MSATTFRAWTLQNEESFAEEMQELTRYEKRQFLRQKFEEEQLHKKRGRIEEEEEEEEEEREEQDKKRGKDREEEDEEDEDEGDKKRGNGRRGHRKSRLRKKDSLEEEEDEQDEDEDLRRGRRRGDSAGEDDDDEEEGDEEDEEDEEEEEEVEESSFEEDSDEWVPADEFGGGSKKKVRDVGKTKPNMESGPDLPKFDLFPPKKPTQWVQTLSAVTTYRLQLRNYIQERKAYLEKVAGLPAVAKIPVTERPLELLRLELERRGLDFSGPRELLLFRLKRAEKGKFVPRAWQYSEEPKPPTYLAIPKMRNGASFSLIGLPHDLVRALLLSKLVSQDVISLGASAKYFYNDCREEIRKRSLALLGHDDSIALVVYEKYAEIEERRKDVSNRYILRSMPGWRESIVGSFRIGSWHRVPEENEIVEDLKGCIGLYGCVKAFICERDLCMREKLFRAEEKRELYRTSKSRVEIVNELFRSRGLPPLMEFNLDLPERFKILHPTLYAVFSLMIDHYTRFTILSNTLVRFVFRGLGDPESKLFKRLPGGKFCEQILTTAMAFYHGPLPSNRIRYGDSDHRFFYTLFQSVTSFNGGDVFRLRFAKLPNGSLLELKRKEFLALVAYVFAMPKERTRFAADGSFNGRIKDSTETSERCFFVFRLNNPDRLVECVSIAAPGDRYRERWRAAFDEEEAPLLARVLNIDVNELSKVLYRYFFFSDTAWKSRRERPIVFLEDSKKE